MEFLVDFVSTVRTEPWGLRLRTAQAAEASIAAKLVEDGHLLCTWKPAVAPVAWRALGLFYWAERNGAEQSASGPAAL